MAEDAKKLVCRNRRARFQYHLEDSFEAGMVLRGTEVKSLRAGNASLNDAYGRFRGDELYLVNAHIAPYADANRDNHEPERERKLLLSRRELRRLGGKVRERGYTLVPLEIYFKGSYAKVSIALARGKRLYDKRQTVEKRDSDRRLRRILKRGSRRG
jgi:SsrA-binding protein